MSYPKLRALQTHEAFTAHLRAIGVTLPMAAAGSGFNALAQPAVITDGSAGTLRAANRFVALPMEGWDGTADGCPTELVQRRWRRLSAGGAAIIWGEATAVRRDGRANPRQLVLDDRTVGEFARLRALLAPDQIAGLQLTHSGRFSRPDGRPAPRTAYVHPYLDPLVGASPATVLDDDDLDALTDDFVRAAALAREAGFDFVDVKHCHGYLLHELLSAYERPGRYGGSFEHRTRFLRRVAEGVRRRSPDLALAVRVSIFDFAPRHADISRTSIGGYPYAFGGDGSGAGIDLTEPHRFFELLEQLGIGLVCTTAGSPYYTPHIQRPAYFPPSDGYPPPEDPLVGVARQISATAELVARHSALTVVGSGYSYLQEWLPAVAEGAVAMNMTHLVGIGRVALAYPELPRDVLSGRPLETRRFCRTFSDCTTAPRNGMVSGCYPLDPFYRSRPEYSALVDLKARRASERRR